MPAKYGIHRFLKHWRYGSPFKRSSRAGKHARAFKPRFPWGEAHGIACELLQQLNSLQQLDHYSVAGSLRRCTETVGDIDLVVATTQPQRVSAAFLSLPWRKVRLHKVGQWETKVFTTTQERIPVDLWIVHPDEYGVALFNRTGSTAYLMKAYKLALEKRYGEMWPQDLKAHYSAFLEGRPPFRTLAQMEIFLSLVNAGATELDVFRALDRPWVAPALRA